MKSFISIALSLLMLVSSSGLTYAQHFCGDFEMMNKITLGEEHLSCGMVMDSNSCGDEESEKHNCCDNQFTTVDTDDNFAKASFDLEIHPTFIIAFVSAFMLEQQENYDENLDFYIDYSPPPLGERLHLLYDQFLI